MATMRGFWLFVLSWLAFVGVSTWLILAGGYAFVAVASAALGVLIGARARVGR